MAEMRNISALEINDLQAGIFAGVLLTGYYSKGDTPHPIIYSPSSTTEIDDGGSVIEIGNFKLAHEFKGYIDVVYFGTKNNEDNTIKIQNCINAAIEGSIVVCNGDYLISSNAVTINSGIRLKRMISLEINGNLKINNPTNQTSYTIVSAYMIDNFHIYGKGTINGDRINNNMTTGESGHGISIYECSNFTIKGLKIFDCWGDGINLGGTSGSNVANNKGCMNFEISGVTCTNNRRQGLSIVSGSNGRIINSIFEKTNGTMPQSGIDIEPNNRQSTFDIVIDSCILRDNARAGLQIYADREFAILNNITVINSTITNNRTGILVRKDKANDLKILNNYISKNQFDGISVQEGVKNILISGNSISQNLRAIGLNDVKYVGITNCILKENPVGIALSGNPTKNCIIDNNMISNCTESAILSSSCDILNIKNNILNDSNGGIRFSGGESKNINIEGNTFNKIAQYACYFNNVINVNIQNNSFLDNGFEIDNSYSSIRIMETVHIFNIGGNNFKDLNLENKNKYCINANLGSVGRIGNNNYIGGFRQLNIQINGSTSIELIDEYKQSADVQNILSTSLTPTTTNNANDLDSVITLTNDLKWRYNNQLLPIINETKTQVNTKFAADRDSGQQSTT